MKLNGKNRKGVNSLVNSHPWLVKEWNYKKNSKSISEISQGSRFKAWWICEIGHEWNVTVSSRTNYLTNCPYCAGNKVLPGFNDLETIYPHILTEWDYSINKILPSEVSPSSTKKAWWKHYHMDSSNWHRWEAKILARTSNHNGCPYCASQRILEGFNDLNALFPLVAAEWHPTKNAPLKPSEVTSKSKKKVWWLGTCGHEWIASIGHRTVANSNCPYCAGQKVLPGFNDLATRYPEIASQWHPNKNGTLLPTELYYSSHTKIWGFVLKTMNG